MTSQEFFHPDAQLFASEPIVKNLHDDAAASAQARRGEVGYTQRHLQTLTHQDLDQLPAGTPPVTENLLRLSQRKTFADITAHLTELGHGPINVSLFGIAFAEGVPWVSNFIEETMRIPLAQFTVLDIDPTIITQVRTLELPSVTANIEDARHTQLASCSQDLIIRDHIGNCCPPGFDEAIDREVHRVLKPGGLAIVNITTSELLSQSAGRRVVSHSDLLRELGADLVHQLQQHLYDLEALSRTTPLPTEHLRGQLLEIEPDHSFAVFGDTGVGQGEWFRPIGQHIDMWTKHGFTIIDHSTRTGQDSHTPPLECQRHIVVLKKEEHL